MTLAGCGGSGSGGGSGATTTASSEGGPKGLEISDEAKACLKEKGVELPSAAGGKGGQPPQGSRPPAAGQAPEGGEMPGGGESSGGVPSAGGPGGDGFEAMKTALEECGVQAPGAQGRAGRDRAPVKSAVFKRQVKEYAACVRKNGYELAEPNFSGDGPVFKTSESESAAFKRASAKCQSLLGGPRPGSRSEGESGT